MPDGSRRVELTLEVTAMRRAAHRAQAGRRVVDPDVAEVGPLPIALQRPGSGNQMGEVTVPLTGTWRLAVTVRTSAIDEATGYVDVPVE